jgi:predicted lipid-binding transport protein (Tim44 family)
MEMRKLLGVMIALIGLSLVVIDADARRMGGGRSIGKQREAVNQNQPVQRQQQQAAPAQQQQAAPAQNAAPTAAPAPQPSGMSRWLGPLAGLALGAGLAALFFNNGFAGALLGILLVAALVVGAVFLVRLLRGGRTVREPLRYAGAGASADPYGRREPARAPAPAPISGAAAPHSVAATTGSAQPVATASRWPADFDAEQFLRHARSNFVNLQSAYDRREMDVIRDFLTPEMAREIEAEMGAAGNAQKTDVVTLEAEVLDVTEENGFYVVSVRFSGLIREDAATEAQPFKEIWHLEKPVRGRSGWLVSGIQQA